MAGLFTVPQRAGRAGDSAIAKKAKSKARKSTVTVKGGGGIFERINTIRAVVLKNLGKYQDEYIVIQDEDTLDKYISSCIVNNVISIDTETTGLDPIADEIVGICIYTPGEKAAYIPLNHISFVTNMKVENQLPVHFVREQFQRIADAAIDIIMFNACFDARFMKNQVGVRLKCTWDCYLAARLLNENEGAGNNGLKALYNKYVLDGKGDAFKFDDLFKGISFAYVPISVGYLYAAHDAIITYEYYLFQKPFLTYDDSVCIKHGLVDVAHVFHEIEMPCIEVVADMEDTGVAFDFDYAKELSEKYHAELENKIKDFYELCNMYSDDIAQYRANNPNCKLSDPINIDSPTQLAILLYDIIGVDPVDNNSPRGTAEDILLKMKLPICDAVLAYRGVNKLINTYIDKLPGCANPKDNRIHCKFNQYGADTGRFSSTDPNLQNIPSHNKDIRKMFKATDGYVLMSSDYSQQEPKMMAQLCGDKQMLDAYKHGKDLYAQIASLSFNKPYDDCLEFRPDGTTNKEGKERRGNAKSILLGALYGRGVPSIAEQLNITVKKAQAIKDSVFKGFPAIEKFENDSLHMAKTLGYVTTLWGRKRRLPILQKPDYEFKWKDGIAPDNDPLGFDDDAELSTEVPKELKDKYLRRLSRAYFSQKRKIFEDANEEGIWIIDNTKLKADATRQVVNARIQGSAADMSKLAMIKVGTDERLKELGFRLLIPVHDELIAECPEENAKECSERFAYLMSTAAEKLTIPISCDVEITHRWYGETVKV
nr:MAG TPA: DNA polymerase [Caudoviricetes sp.]